LKKREFNKHLNACRTKDKKRLDLSKLEALSKEIRLKMAHYVVCQRGPLIMPLAACCDSQWLHSMGYMYKTIGKTSGLKFQHTCEHIIN